MYAWKLRREWEILFNQRERLFWEWTAHTRHDLTFAGARMNVLWGALALQFKEQEVCAVMGHEVLAEWIAETASPSVALTVDAALWAEASNAVETGR